METNGILNGVYSILEDVNYTPTCTVTIDGEDHQFDEIQMKALQVLCGRFSEIGKFEEFISRVQVWEHNSKEKQMVFNPNGTFATEFSYGFYTAARDLSFMILRKAAKLDKNK